MFSTTRMVGRQPYATAAFTPGEIPGTHFQGLRRPQGTWFRRITTTTTTTTNNNNNNNNNNNSEVV